MSILLIAAAAAVAAPVHSTSFEDNGKTYTVDYIAHIATRSHLDHVRSAHQAGLQRCVSEGTISVERRITDRASGQSMSTRLAGDTSLSHARAGRCTATSSDTQALIAERSDAIDAHLAEVARSDRSHLAGALSAARSLAAR